MTNHHTKIQNPLYEIPNDGGKIKNSAEMKNIHGETKLAVGGIQKALHFAKMKNLCTRFKLAGGRIQNAPHQAEMKSLGRKSKQGCWNLKHATFGKNENSLWEIKIAGVAVQCPTLGINEKTPWGKSKQWGRF